MTVILFQIPTLTGFPVLDINLDECSQYVFGSTLCVYCKIVQHNTSHFLCITVGSSNYLACIRGKTQIIKCCFTISCLLENEYCICFGDGRSQVIKNCTK